MKAIVTGGAGFVGSHLAARLIREGWDVFVVDNLSSGIRENVPQEAEFRWADLSEGDSLKKLPKSGVDAVFHLASHVGQELSFEQPIYDLKTNALSTLHLLQWCAEHAVKKFIFASTVNVYGNAETLPITESAPIQPPSPYAVGKVASEHLCRIFEDFGVKSTCLRLFNVYGPGQDMRNLKQGIVSIYLSYVARGEELLVRGSLDRFRDLVYVDDVVDAFYRCLHPQADGKTYNVATGRKVYVREIVDYILAEFGHEFSTYPVINADSTRRDQFGFYGDSTLIQKELGWKVTVPMEEGIRRMATWAKTLTKYQLGGEVINRAGNP